MGQYFIFKDFRQFVLALHVRPRTRHEGMPEEVVLLDDSGAAVPAELFTTKADCHAYCDWLRGQFAMNVTLSDAQPSGHARPLAPLVDGLWRYCDPVRVHESAAALAVHEGDGEPLGLAGRDYILGASDATRNARLLDALTQALIPGIEARPLRFVNGSSPSPCSHLWHITGGTPPLFVFEATDGAWWGPIAGTDHVYEEWPYTLDISSGLLRETPWGKRLALLSREPAGTMLVDWNPEEAPFAELIRVADLQCRESAAPHVVHTREPEVEFRVELRLTPHPPQQRLHREREQIESEIKHLQRQLRVLEESISDPDEALCRASEPLYLYHSPIETREKPLPFQLRRLFLEWADQAEDLGALQYVRLDGASLPNPLNEGRPAVHVVTTAAALGKGRPSAAATRLRDYAPLREDGALTRFEMAPEWASMGLRLFLPEEQHLTLYPAMRPSSLGAQKLSRALSTGQGAALPEKVCCFVLAPVLSNSLASLRIPLDAFLPFKDAYTWECSASARRHDASILANNAGHAREMVVESVETALASVYREQLCKRLDALDAFVQLRQTRMTEIGQKAQSIGEALAQCHAIIGTCRASCEEMLRRAIATQERAESINARNDSIRDALTGLDQINKEILALQGRCRTIIAALH